MTTLNPDTITLAKGAHSTCEDGMCLFEAYNMIARHEHTDTRPPGVSVVLHTMGMRLNDTLTEDRRQQLKAYLPRPDGTSPLAGTADDGLDETRSYMALDWLIRTYTPAWLDLAGLTEEAAALRDLRRIADLVAAQAAGPVVRASREKARAARAAAGDAAGAAAGDAAGDAARDAARAAAGAAAGDAAGDAAWAAAWDAAWAAARAAAWAAARDAARAAAGDAAGAAARDAARDAARAAAGAAAGDAAGDAARAAARDAARDAARAAAGDAARDAARDAADQKLKPTVDQLQDSALALYATMIHPQPVSGA